MMARTRLALTALVGAALIVSSAQGAALTDSLKKGTPDLKAAGPLAFGPEGILFIGDPQGGALFAVATGDTRQESAPGTLKVEGVNEKIAGLLGTTPKDILINDLAVNPASGRAYLSVSRGKGPDAIPVIVRADRSGKVEEVSLKDVPFAKATLPEPGPASKRDAITHLAYVNGRVFVAALSNEEFGSKLRAVPFPFTDVAKGTSVEIYHGSHGRFETKSPIRTFAPYSLKNQDYLLAAYTCTPLVKVPVADLKPGEHVKGKTIAELGNHNRPISMIVYQKDGKDYILMTNDSRGVMKIPAEGADQVEPIAKRISDKAGLKYETIESLKGARQIDRLDQGHALVLIETKSGAVNLETIALP